MKNFTRFYYSTFLLILCLGFSQVASSQIQATMAVRGTINSFGNDAMTYRSTLAQTWMATVQATTTNASAGFLFANKEIRLDFHSSRRCCKINRKYSQRSH